MKTLYVDGYISKFYQLFKEEKNINATKTLRDQGKTEYFLNPFMKQLHLVLKTQQRYHKQKNYRPIQLMNIYVNFLIKFYESSNI